MIHEEKVSKEFAQKVKGISRNLGIKPDWLMHLIYFESAKTFSPSVKNPISGATGLIQFMPQTAQGLGTSTEELSSMTAEQQLTYVEKYLKQYPVSNAESYGELYLAVLYPYALRKQDSYVLGSHNGTATTVRNQNQIFDTNGDGKITKKEVVDYQNREAEKFGLKDVLPVQIKQGLSKKEWVFIGIVILILIVLFVRYGWK
jgi:hypothetical protein